MGGVKCIPFKIFTNIIIGPHQYVDNNPFHFDEQFYMRNQCYHAHFILHLLYGFNTIVQFSYCSSN